MKLHLDFETRSPVDLKASGIDVYVHDIGTEILCAAYAFDDEPVELWTPNQVFPQRVYDHVREGGTVIAHNAAFEFNVWNSVLSRIVRGLPQLQLGQMQCTMAEAYAMGLPGGLDDAASALGVEERKDKEGHRIMLMLCRPFDEAPDSSAVYHTPESKPDLFAKLYAYCKQDVVVERKLEKRLLRLSPEEKRVWELDQTINMRGVYFDRVLADRLIECSDVAKGVLDAELREITGKVVCHATEVGAIALWLEMHGVDVPSLRKQDVIDMLKIEDMPEPCRRVLEIRQAGSKAAITKLRAMVRSTSDDGRMRHLHQYHGAGTGRWAGRRVQTQNLKRPTIDNQDRIESICELVLTLPPEQAIEAIEMVHGPVMEMLSDCLRAVICAAPGHVLMAPDFFNVEGRGVAWLSGEAWKIDAFIAQDNGTGPGIYELSYARAQGVDIKSVTKAMRQIGKVQELSMGYAGGKGAFQNMAKNYGVKVGDAQAEEIKVAWREAHPMTVQAWQDLEDAAFEAVLYPGRLTFATPKRIAFRVNGSFLWCRLPSGRKLCYPFPRIELCDMPWKDENGKPAKRESVTYMGVDSKTKKWSRQKIYGGKWMENVIQALCRDLLVEAMFAAESNGFPIVMHVHDELVPEVPEDQAHRLDELEGLVSVLPEWAEGFPLSASGWTGKRYRK